MAVYNVWHCFLCNNLELLFDIKATFRAPNHLTELSGEKKKQTKTTTKKTKKTTKTSKAKTQRQSHHTFFIYIV